MTFLEQLFSTKTMQESSKKLYMNNLNKLNHNIEIVDLDFLKNTEAIEEIISKYKPTTKRSFIIAIISVVKSNPDLYKKYFDLLTQMNGKLKIKSFEDIYDIHLLD